MINSIISSYMIRIFGFFGLRVEKFVEKGKIQEYVNQLIPLTTEIELIRIGGDGDGGYLVPNDLENIVALFSPGVAETATFELEIARRGVISFLADFSVDNSPCEHANIQFEKVFIGSKKNEMYITLADWIKSKDLPDDGDLLLQMDIEGGEYETILSTSNEVLSRFRILVIEFHYLDKASTYFGNKVIIETFTKLLEQFAVVHIHPNNCCPPISVHGIEIHPCVEITLLRRDRFEQSRPTMHFPHELDWPNLEGRRDYQWNVI